ncbi:DNA cytosine methyltransferase [Streptomyces violaceusniger]|uniref:DNA (cytosine-5-)-methyltransferase n=1 Tax=Streptomyces violaceusniger (strain Tu 4113) TaxID=653045 RepID=G2PHM2_STRV4|nr:DNA cytosine methyltransferase [Streptomyces violaceusniger]AEM88823.1 C-5 cytosine-specific DNA methylase [Streptomyces violaceusniger Tu 4113]
MAVQHVFNARTVWHCENAAAPAAVLAHHFPDVPNLGNLKAVDFTGVEGVDILAAGFPCQDVSIAGPRDGMREGNRSGLWRDVARAIEILQPTWVVIENVRGLLSQRAHGVLEPCTRCVGHERPQDRLRALGAVLGDLALLGFDAEWLCLRASDAGAPHRRDRTFILARRAFAEDSDLEHWLQWRDSAPGQAQARRPWPDAGGRGGVGAAADSVSLESERGRAPGELGGAASAESGEEDQRKRSGTSPGCGCPDADDPGCGIVWGRYEQAIRRWEELIGRPAPCPIGWVKTGRRITPEFVEWMMGLPQHWVTGVPGISRTRQFTVLGNGVVPQQAVMALTILRERFSNEELCAEEAVQLLLDLDPVR